MPCYYPLKAYRKSSGDIIFVERGDCRELTLACGQCIGCRLERSRQWAVRCMHEAQMHDANSFVTLTYNDDFLPPDLSLNYRHFQLFVKRLRKHFSPLKIRFYMCGEYGETYSRPHYHACLFGVHFADRYYWRKSPAGFNLYRSATLESLWTSGSAEIGDVTFDSAAYVARYIMKKVNGDLAHEHYKVVDSDTGEIHWRTPEFTKMSLKPGIGAKWFDRYRDEVFPLDRVVVNGHECVPPRYYKVLLDRLNTTMSDDVEYKRYLKGIELAADNTEGRLRVKEVVTKAAIKQLKRRLE